MKISKYKILFTRNQIICPTVINKSLASFTDEFSCKSSSILVDLFNFRLVTQSGKWWWRHWSGINRSHETREERWPRPSLPITNRKSTNGRLNWWPPTPGIAFLSVWHWNMWPVLSPVMPSKDFSKLTSSHVNWHLDAAYLQFSYRNSCHNNVRISLLSV